MYGGSYNTVNMARIRLRRKHELEDEVVIDFKQPLDQIEFIILNSLCSSELTIGQIVNYLKHFCRYCLKRFEEEVPKKLNSDDINKIYPIVLHTDRDILFCLRVTLFHDSAEVRAQTLRAMRYFIRTKECVKALLQLSIHHLIARSLDFRVKNQFERLQALRLMRHVMTFDTEIIPIVFGRCLCAIVSDNLNEKDPMVKPCMATIAELTLVNPIVSYKTGCIRILVSNAVNVVLGGNITPNMVNDNRQLRNNNHNANDMLGIAIGGKLTCTELSTSNIVLLEAMLSSFLHLFNWPETRRLLLPNGEDFYVFIAPFTDTYSFLHASLAAMKNCPTRVDNPFRDNRPDPKNIAYQQGVGAGGGNRPGGNNAASYQCTFEERMLRYSACKYCLLSILRSWPGVFFMCRIMVDLKNDELQNQNEQKIKADGNVPISKNDYTEIYNQTNLIPLRSLQDSLKFFGIEGRRMPRKVTQLVSGVGKAINSNSLQTSSFFTATSYESMTPIESLISILHLPYPEVHKHLLELVFELFGLRLPKWQEQFEDCTHYVYFALLSKTVRHQTVSSQQSKNFYPNEWQLYDGFVNKEAEHVLPCKATSRLNFVTVYHAILLQAMVEYGLIEALVSVVLDSDDICCVNLATILIGELIHLSGKYLPASIYAHRCQSLPSLVAASVSNHKSRRSRALAAIANIHQIHELKKRTPQPASLYLEQQLFFCKVSNGNAPLKSHSVSFNKGHDEMVLSLIKSSLVVKKNNYKEWNWEIIADILRHPGDGLKKLEDKDVHRSFIRRLLDFYKPSNRYFSNISKTAGSTQSSETVLYSNKEKKEPIYMENPRQLGIVATLFVDFLLACDENKIYEFIEDFLLDLDNCIKAIAKPTLDRDDQVFISSRMQSTLSHYYFLLIGRFTHSLIGRRWLERTQIHQYIIDMINLNKKISEVYFKLLVSSLDYSDVKFSQAILRKILTSTSDSIRLYSTQFLRVLLRAGASNFSEFAIELLIFQLYDQHSSVALASLDILDEACAADSTCLLKLIAQRPTFLHLGDAGIVFMARFASIPAGLVYLRQSNMLDNELTRWKEMFCARYVCLAEDSLNEIFSLHQRNETGAYGRRSDRDRTSLWPNLKRVSMVLYAMPHLYGQLAHTTKGVEILKKEDILGKLSNIMQKRMNLFLDQPRKPDPTYFRPNEADTLKMKAAIWSIGHIMTTDGGVRLVLESKKQFIDWITSLAKNSLNISLRGTCYLVLCLISSTKRGSNVLKKYGWIPIEHSSEEIFPINQQEYDNFYYDGRPRFMSDPEKMIDSSDSLLTSTNSTEDEEDIGGRTEKSLSKHSTEESSSFLSVNKKERLDGRNEVNKNSIASSLNSVNSIGSNTSSLGCLEMVPTMSSTNSRNRPRSSSDCVTTIKNCDPKKVMNQVSDTGGKTAYLLSNDSAEDRNRKISAPCVTLTPDVTKDGRSDSNESGNTNTTAFYSSGIESRSTSFADFSTSSCASNTIEHGNKSSNTILPNTVQKIDSIPNHGAHKEGNDSMALNVNMTLDGIKNGSDRSKRKKRNTLSNRRIANTFHITDDPYPSPMDAHGYAQLRAIQKQRVQSLSVNGFFTGVTTPIEQYNDGLVNEAKSPTKTSRDNLFDSLVPDISVNTRQRKTSNALVQPVVTLDPNGSFSVINGSIDSAEFDNIIPLRLFQRSSSHVSKRSIECTIPMPEIMGVDNKKGDNSAKVKENFLCLALPENLSKLFSLVEKTTRPEFSSLVENEQSTSNRLDEEKVNRKVVKNDGLELHQPAKCILCFYQPRDELNKEDNIRLWEKSKMDEPTTSNSESQFVAKKNENGSNNRLIAIIAGSSNAHCSETSLTLQRKEVIRLVISLSSSMTAKSTEQELLNLKQRFPNLFEDFCLYSEVCLLMESCHYRASARRFLHELFLDVSPNIFYKRYKQIMAHKKPVLT